MQDQIKMVRVYNNSKQMIPIHMRQPGGDFFLNEQQVRLMPGKDVVLPESHLMSDQIGNLCKRGMIKIFKDK